MQNFMGKLICVIIIFVMSIFLLPENSVIYSALEIKKPEVGEKIYLPDPNVHKQYNGIVEGPYNFFNWIYDQGKLNKIWNDKGCCTTEDNLCYLQVGGVEYILVAVSPIFGEVGDYLKVHVNHDGEEKDYYMMVCDTKNPEDKTIYWVNGIPYGHTSGNGRTMLNVLEFPYNGAMEKIFNFTDKLVYVEYIINGGNYFDNPDGPVGFNTSGSSEPDTESETFLGACGSFFREIWDSLATFMDNEVAGTNKSTVLYALNSRTTYGWVWPYPGCSSIASYFGPRGPIKRCSQCI